MSDNPFERYEIDPRAGPAEITAEFRRLMEDAKTEDERATLRLAWEELTLHPRDRLIAALSTFSETREEMPLGVDDDEPPRAASLTVFDLGLTDLLAPPKIASALGQAPAAPADPDPILEDPTLDAFVGERRP